MLNISFKLKGGKHSNKTFKQVLKEDKSYISWMVKAEYKVKGVAFQMEILDTYIDTLWENSQCEGIQAQIQALNKQKVTAVGKNRELLTSEIIRLKFERVNKVQAVLIAKLQEQLSKEEAVFLAEILANYIAKN